MSDLHDLLAKHRELALVGTVEEGGAWGSWAAVADPELALALNRVAEASERLRSEPHHVTFHETGWELEHDLRCRARGMRYCPIHDSLKEIDEPPTGYYGRFTVIEDEDQTLIYTKDSNEDPAIQLLSTLTQLHEVMQRKIGDTDG